MNHRTSIVCVVSSIVALLLASHLVAAPFEPSFTIAKVTGTCEVQAPDASESEAAVEGKAYAYGTLIRAGSSSSCIVSFSEDNGCLVCQNTTARITQQEKNKKFKIVRVVDGEVEFNLEKDFHKYNQLSVETPSAVCKAIGCTFATGFQIVGDLKTSTFRCSEGEIGATGDYFSITDFGADDQVTISETPNNNFIRVKIVKGEVTLVLRDENGGERRVTLVAGDELTIMASESPTDPTKLDVVYKVVLADQQKAEIPPWQTTFPKPFLTPPEDNGAAPGPVPPLPKERKWSSLTIAPPIPTVTPVGKL